MAFALGAHVGQQDLTMDELRATWRRLDEAGLDWISAWDHFYEAPPRDPAGTQPHFEAIATLAAMALETKQARLGCYVFYVGYRNPASLAKAAITLDHLSGGRFELGLGAGWHVQEATAYGYDFPPIGQRLQMLDEATTIIRGMLTEERTTFHGKHFHVENASCLPHPVQERLPIWIGGQGEKVTLRLAARHADGWNAAYTTPENFKRLNGVLDEWCEKEGRDPASIRRTANLTFNLATDAASAEVERRRVQEQWGAGAERAFGGGLFGTPDQAVERIMQYREAGAAGVNVALRAPWNAEALDAYLDEVVPATRKAAGS